MGRQESGKKMEGVGEGKKARRGGDSPLVPSRLASLAFSLGACAQAKLKWHKNKSVHDVL